MIPLLVQCKIHRVTLSFIVTTYVILVIAKLLFTVASECLGIIAFLIDCLGMGISLQMFI